MRDIFEPREALRPFEYPEAINIMDLISKTYWVHNELNFDSDNKDIAMMPLTEREGVIRNLLAISTIEVAVKTFWTKLGEMFPKVEFEMLGVAAGESEARHFMSYSRILDECGLNDRFADVKNIPCIKGRFEYLNKYLRVSHSTSDKKKLVVKLILFSCLIEHTSLFGQFIPLTYMYKYQGGIMKNIRNIINWTAKDEVLHFNIGALLVNILRQEQPELFDEEMDKVVRAACLKSIKYESDILDWIWEHGELEGLSKVDILAFMKNQVNESMEQMGFDKCFEDIGDLSATAFFKTEMFGDTIDDFFAVRPTDYTMASEYTEDSLF